MTWTKNVKIKNLPKIFIKFPKIPKAQNIGVIIRDSTNVSEMMCGFFLSILYSSHEPLRKIELLYMEESSDVFSRNLCPDKPSNFSLFPDNPNCSSSIPQSSSSSLSVSILVEGMLFIIQGLTNYTLQTCIVANWNNIDYSPSKQEYSACYPCKGYSIWDPEVGDWIKNFADPPSHIFFFSPTPPPHMLYFNFLQTPPHIFIYFSIPPPQDLKWNSPKLLPQLRCKRIKDVSNIPRFIHQRAWQDNDKIVPSLQHSPSVFPNNMSKPFFNVHIMVLLRNVLDDFRICFAESVEFLQNVKLSLWVVFSSATQLDG